MNSLDSVIGTYTVDLSLRPTAFDFWHVCLAGLVALLLLIIIFLLIALIFRKGHVTEVAAQPMQPAITQPMVRQPVAQPEPEIKIVEKIVEVEKLIPSENAKPVILKEYTSDAALQVLSLLQKEARFLDFMQEDITTFSDADVGAAARVVHTGCLKVIKDNFTLVNVRNEAEGSLLTVPEGFDASLIRLTGNIVGSPPFTGTLVHKGWQITEVKLPKLTENHNPNIVAAAQVEL